MNSKDSLRLPAPVLGSRLFFEAQAELGQLLSTRTSLQRIVSSGLRVLTPTTVVGNTAIVTRHADVAELLNDPSRFKVSEIYGPKMARTTGAFLLGHDDSAVYAREASYIRSALAASDWQRIRSLSARHAQHLLDRAARVGSIDAAGGYAHELAMTLVAEYFGVRGPDDITLTRWLRNLYWDLYLNPTEQPKVSQTALTDARALLCYLDAQIAELHARYERGVLGADTFFERLLRQSIEQRLSDDLLRRTLAGVIVSVVEALSKTIVNALDQLLRRPKVLARARQAAFAGNDELVANYAFEALRFSPQQPMLMRYCPRAVWLAQSTKRATRIPAGTTVYASTLSAMFDGSVVREPGKFRVDRPWTHYLHLGDGMHRCFGEVITRTVVPQAIKALLQRNGLGRIAGPEGRIVYDGPFPVRWTLRI